MLVNQLCHRPISRRCEATWCLLHKKRKSWVSEAMSPEWLKVRQGLSLFGCWCRFSPGGGEQFFPLSQKKKSRPEMCCCCLFVGDKISQSCWKVFSQMSVSASETYPNNLTQLPFLVCLTMPHFDWKIFCWGHLVTEMFKMAYEKSTQATVCWLSIGSNSQKTCKSCSPWATATNTPPCNFYS